MIKENTDLYVFMSSLCAEFRACGRYGTARLYESVSRSLRQFGSSAWGWSDWNPSLLKSYERYLRGRGCSWNTVSTYLRVLRAVWHRALSLGLCPFVPRLFSDVYTGTSSPRKLALDKRQLGRLFAAPLTAGRLRRARDLFVLMFHLRGIPFADLAFLRKTDIRHGVLRYRRRKTGTLIEVRLSQAARRLLASLADAPAESPYLFSFVRSREGSSAAYREYRSSLRSFNAVLRRLALSLRLGQCISSYTARHSWATLAYHCEVHPGIISQAMGHSSIAVTETYLKPFLHDRIETVSRKLVRLVWKASVACGFRHEEENLDAEYIINKV